LKLWFVIRSYGVDGLVSHIREHCRLAREFAVWVDDDPAFKRLAPVPVSTVCFRYRPDGIGDESELERLNADLIDAVNATGEAFLSHTKLSGKYTIRLAIGNVATQAKHVARAWQLLRDLSANLRESMPAF